jgi:hypothetical protein
LAAAVARNAWALIADEVISHLAGLEGSSVTVTLEIEAAMGDWSLSKTSCAQ